MRKQMPQPDPQRPRRSRASWLLILGLLAGLFVWVGAPAQAAEEPREEITFNGTLRDAGSALPGVIITVISPDGEEFTGESAENGRWSIAVPRMDGAYEVTLDEESLPDDVHLRKGDATTQTVTPSTTLPSTSVNFRIGESTRQVKTKWDRVPQLVWNGLLFGLVMALAALGLSMVFGTTGLVNFAHGELVTFGALWAFFLNKAGVPFVAATLVAVLAAAAFGWFQEAGLWGPLRRRGTGLIAMMIVSIGLMFFLRNFFQYLTQGRTATYDDYVTQVGVDVLGASITPRDMVIAGVSIVVVIAVILALNLTRLGRATRAVADNPALAAASGINVDRVISIVWIIGTALAALAGVFLGFNIAITFQIGQVVLLLLFAAVCVGGLGSVWGALIGALIIGLLIELSTLVIPSELKNAGAMLLLALILLFRPQGLLGRKERVG
jgi:neutral amino acid transport system permease protein